MASPPFGREEYIITKEFKKLTTENFAASL